MHRLKESILKKHLLPLPKWKKMGINSTLLNGEMEEDVYIEKTEGFLLSEK